MTSRLTNASLPAVPPPNIKGEHQTPRGAEHCVERAEAQVVVVTRPLR